MKKFYFIGIDVSKNKVDICVISNSKVLKEEQCTNHQAAISSEIKAVQDEFGVSSEDFIVCAEHTGQYTYPLICACKGLDCKLWLENPAQIKYCSGVTRGKNDRVDARRIAEYAMRFIDKCHPYERPEEDLTLLKQLEAERSLYKTDLAKYKAQLSDQEEYMERNIFLQKAKRLKRLIETLEETLKDITDKMTEIIEASSQLSLQMELLRSVEGVGPVIAMNMIIATEAFTKFENYRQFNCYIGVAPFSYTSGSSQFSKNRVSQKAAKYLKVLLHLAAVSITHRKTGDLKTYFDRKVAEGKNKMTVINAVRAKIVARMFAVIRKNQFYQPILSF